MPALRSLLAVAREDRTERQGKRRTNFEYKGVEFLLCAKRDDEHLGRSDDGGQREDTALDVLLATPERVLEQSVEDAAKSKRGFDHVRGEFADYVIVSVRIRPRREQTRTGLLERLSVYGHEIWRQRDLSLLSDDRGRPAP